MTVPSTLAMRSGRFVLVIATVRCFYDVASKMPAEYVVALRVRSGLCRTSFVDIAKMERAAVCEHSFRRCPPRKLKISEIP